MRKRIWTLLIIAMLLLCGSALANEDPVITAECFFEAVAKCDWTRAARGFCLDGSLLYNWDPPLITKHIVYPSVSDIKAVDVQIDGDRAHVTLSITAVDPSDEEVQWNSPYMLWMQDPYETEMTTEMINDLAYYYGDLKELLGEHRREYTVPIELTYAQDEWWVDLPATLEKWTDAPPADVRAESYGLTTYDAASLWYYLRELRCPRDQDYLSWWMSLTKEDVFDMLDTPAWNVWLRLTSTVPEEGLGDFKLIGGACSPSLVVHSGYLGPHATDTTTVRFAEYGGAQHAVLLMDIPLEERENLPEDCILRCKRRLNIDTPLYVEQVVEIPLGGVPYAESVPEKGVHFSAESFTRVYQSEIEYEPGTAWPRIQSLPTLGDAMSESFYEPSSIYVWRNISDEILSLPVINDQYALYLLYGTVQKSAGYYGVYDISFHVSSNDAIVPLAYCCSFCHINECELHGGESGWKDTAQAPFVLPVLIPLEGRAEEELDNILYTLSLTATFSGEKIDFFDEHGYATRIGPRTTLPVDLSHMTRWYGEKVEQMPISESKYY